MPLLPRLTRLLSVVSASSCPSMAVLPRALPAGVPAGFSAAQWDCRPDRCRDSPATPAFRVSRYTHPGRAEMAAMAAIEINLLQSVSTAKYDRHRHNPSLVGPR